MWIAYIDETGNTGRNLNDANQPIHSLTALLVHERSIQPVHARVRAIAESWFPDAFRNARFEFHGADIFGRKGFFAQLDDDESVALYRELMSVIGGEDVRVITRGVSKTHLAARYPNPYHPHDVALMFTLEEIERFALKTESPAEPCLFMVVADKNQEIEGNAIRDLASYQEVGTQWGWRPIEIKHIVDTMHFADSHTNAGLQLADCAAFIEGRRARNFRSQINPTSRSSQAVSAIHDDLIAPHQVALTIWEP